MGDNNKYDYGVSFARCIATFMIVLCHVQQYYDIYACWWFNVGVQMFFFISGFLYGQKEIIDGYLFIKKRLSRILVDYYVCLAMDLIVMFIFCKENLTAGGVLGLITLSGTVAGLGHLWFVPVICFLYIATPIYTRVIDDAEKFLMKRIKNIPIKKIIEILLFIVFFYWVNKFVGVLYWVNSLIYCIGLMAGKSKVHNQQKQKWLKSGLIFTVPIAVICTVIAIYHERVSNITIFVTHPRLYSSLYYPLTHACLGIALFCLLYFIEEKLHVFEKLSKFAKFSDKYSYDVYLSHHIWIQNPVSLFNLPLPFVIKLIIVIFATAAQTIATRVISSSAQKIVETKRLKKDKQ